MKDYKCKKEGGIENCTYKSKDFYSCVSLRKCEFSEINQNNLSHCKFSEFCKAWESEIVYNTSCFINEDEKVDYLHEAFFDYKNNSILDVKEFLNFWYDDYDFDRHELMLKSKAIKDKRYNKGLLNLINKTKKQ